MPKNYCIMQIWAESGKSALPICNYSQILYQFLTFTQNLKRSRTNGATPFSVAISYFAIAGSNPYTSRIERSLDGSMLSMSILYESYDIRSIMASARVLSPPQIC